MMNTVIWTETILVLLLLSSFLLLGSSRLGGCIRIGAFQGFIAGLLPFLNSYGSSSVASVTATGVVDVASTASAASAASAVSASIASIASSAANATHAANAVNAASVLGVADAAGVSSSIGDFTIRVGIIGLVTLAIKGLVFPYMLTHAIRESKTSREIQPLVGYMASLVCGVLFLVGAFMLDSKLDLPIHTQHSLFVPVAFTLMMTGLFLIIARRTAINQVIGYLVLENGIYVFGMAIASHIPILIELGVLMDLFVAVFVMGIAVHRINREFDHMDSDRLNLLKG